jgi:hypothetical protein
MLVAPAALAAKPKFACEGFARGDVSGNRGDAFQTRGAMRQSERLVPRADAAIGDYERLPATT